MLAEWATDWGLCTGGAALSGGACPHAATARGQAWHGRTGPGQGDLARPVTGCPPGRSARCPGGANYYRRVANLYQALGEARQPAPSSPTTNPWWRCNRPPSRRHCSGAMPPASALPSMMWKGPGAGSQGAGGRRSGPREDLEGGRADPAGPQSGWGGVAGIRPAQRSRQALPAEPDHLLPRQRLLGLQRYRGYSDLRALTQMAQLDTPLAGGTAFGRLELVDMDAGDLPDSLTGRSSVPVRPGTARGRAPAEPGTTLAAGWQRGPGRSIWGPRPSVSRWWTGLVAPP